MRHLLKLLVLACFFFLSSSAFAQTQSIDASEVQPVIDGLAKSVLEMDRDIALSSGSVKVRKAAYKNYDILVNDLNALFALYQQAGASYQVDIRRSRHALERFMTSAEEFLRGLNARDLGQKDYRKLSKAGEKAKDLAIRLHAFVEIPNTQFPPYHQPQPYPYPDLPVAPVQLSFQQISAAVAMQGNDQLRAQQINYFMRMQSLTTQELIDLMRYIRDDNIRAGVALENYRYVSDAQQNWYNVYDVYNYGGAFDQQMLSQYPGYRPRVNLMSDSDYRELLKTVRGGFLKDQIRTIERAVSDVGVNITVEQLIGLMNTLSFDDDKVNIAAKCYPNVIDKNNWYKVYEALSFTSNRDKLDKRLGL